jgi:Protein of unknown function (DUF1559)/Domain of unknown function (DUF4190)
MIQFSCECGRELKAPEELAGKQVRCPACKQVQTVPASGIATEPREAIPAQAERRRPTLSDDEEEPMPDGPTVTSRKAAWSLGLGIASLFCSLLTGIPAVILGALALGDINRSRGRTAGSGLAIGGIITGSIGVLLCCPAVGAGLLLPAVQKVREAAVQTQSMNNLKQLGLAFHNYHSTYNQLPTAAGSPEGLQPMDAGLSWRVTLLPFLEENARYQQFKLDEPWDSANNKKLLDPTPKVYTLPGQENAPGMTHYRVFVGAGTPLAMPSGRTPARGRSLTEFTNGISNTILIVDAADAVPWSKPDELVYSPNQPVPALRSTALGYMVAMADGSVRYIATNTSEDALRKMITAGDPPKKKGR